MLSSPRKRSFAACRAHAWRPHKQQLACAVFVAVLIGTAFKLQSEVKATERGVPLAGCGCVSDNSPACWAQVAACADIYWMRISTADSALRHALSELYKCTAVCRVPACCGSSRCSPALMCCRCRHCRRPSSEFWTQQSLQAATASRLPGKSQDFGGISAQISRILRQMQDWNLVV